MLRRFCVLAFVLAAVLRPSPLLAQAGSGTLAGAVLDPDGKSVVGAPVLIRNEASGDVRTTATDGVGRFSAANLTAGSYAIEVFVPGFETVRRAGVAVGGGRTEEVAIKLSLANVQETVTVSAALPAAAVAAPSQASLTARSAQSLISAEYIQNYTSPVSDYSQVLLMAPGTFSVSANGPGLGDTKTFFRGFKDGQYNMTYDVRGFTERLAQRVSATDGLLAFRHGRLVYDFYLGRPIPQIRDTRELQPLLDTPHPLYVLTDERGWRILTTGSADTWSVVDRTEIAGRAVVLLRHAPGRPDPQ